MTGETSTRKMGHLRNRQPGKVPSSQERKWCGFVGPTFYVPEGSAMFLRLLKGVNPTWKALLISLTAHLVAVGAAVAVSSPHRREPRPQRGYVAVAVRRLSPPATLPFPWAAGVGAPVRAYPPEHRGLRSGSRRRRSDARARASAAPAPTQQPSADGNAGTALREPSDGVAATTAGDSRIDPPSAPGPKFLPDAVARAQRIAGAEPAFPPLLVRAGVTYVAQAKICVTAEGLVDRITLLKTPDPAIATSIEAAVRGWRYRPMLVAGRPAPFCTLVRFEFRVES